MKLLTVWVLAAAIGLEIYFETGSHHLGWAAGFLVAALNEIHSNK